MSISRVASGVAKAGGGFVPKLVVAIFDVRIFNEPVLKNERLAPSVVQFPEHDHQIYIRVLGRFIVI